MKEITIFEHRKFNQCTGAIQNEIIQKIRRIVTARYSSIEEAIIKTDPYIEFCHEYPELTKLKWFEAPKLFSLIEEAEQKILEKSKIM